MDDTVIASSAALVRSRFQDSALVKQRMLEETHVGAVLRIAEVITTSLMAGGKLLVFGNGGSAADAQHIAAEFLGRYLRDRPSAAAMALTDSSATLTAVANDYAYREVFARQVTGLGVAGDVALGLSTSGSSENVVRAMEAAREIGLVTIGMTGEADCPLVRVTEICLKVPSSETPRIQEGYMLAAHTVCELVEEALFPSG